MKYKDLFLELIKKDIKLKYRNSVLGILWSMINPLLMMIVMTIIFSSLFHRDIENFPVYVLTGRLIYQFFSEATNFSMESIHNNSQLIKKLYVPKYLFPLSMTYSTLITTFTGIVPLVLVMLITGIQFHWVNLLIVYPLICLLLTSIGIGMLLSTLSVFFRDINHLYSIILTVVMYLTPIFYPANIIPEKYLLILELNPLFNIVNMFRSILIDGILPSFSVMVISVMYSLVLFFIGFFIFYKKQDKFIFHL